MRYDILHTITLNNNGRGITVTFIGGFIFSKEAEKASSVLTLVRPQ